MVDLTSRSVLPPELDPRGPRRPPKRRTPARRLVNLIAVVMSLVVVVASVGGYVVVQWFDGSIARIHLNLGQNRPADAGSGTQNWLLVGTDSRAGAGGEYGDVPGQRSDTTILAHLDKDGTTTNVSFPRDSLVTIPAYTDSKGVTHPAHKDKFNSAISLGGPSLLVKHRRAAHRDPDRPLRLGRPRRLQEDQSGAERREGLHPALGLQGDRPRRRHHHQHFGRLQRLPRSRRRADRGR